MHFETYQKLKRLAEVMPECLESLTEDELRQTLREKKGEGADDNSYVGNFVCEHYGAWNV